VRIVAGGEIPPCIIDDCALDRIAEYILAYGVEDGARRFKEATPYELRVQLRAVRMNVYRMKVENGGVFPCRL